MKERLTKHEYENVISVNGKVYYEYPIADVIERLAEYEDLEEQGLIVRLPCKVGDTVYWVYYEKNENVVMKGEISSICINKDHIAYYALAEKDNDMYCLGEVFLTREDAEKRLEELKK